MEQMTDLRRVRPGREPGVVTSPAEVIMDCYNAWEWHVADIESDCLPSTTGAGESDPDPVARHAGAPVGAGAEDLMRYYNNFSS